MVRKQKQRKKEQKKGQEKGRKGGDRQENGWGVLHTMVMCWWWCCLVASMIPFVLQLKRRLTYEIVEQLKNLDQETTCDIPACILHKVFSFLDTKDLCRAGVTCKQWREVSKDEKFWNCLKLRSSIISVEQFISLCESNSNIMEMEISAVVDAELLVIRAASLLRRLERVKVVNVKLSKCFFQALSSCETLQTLELNSCNLVTSISLDSSSLENIRLMHLSKCTDLNLQSPNLSKIEVYKCSALKHVSITSDVLERLVLRKQEVLAHLSLKCKTLVEVDLTGCKSLTTTISEVFSDGGGCPMLTRLVLDNCESLDMVKFRNALLSSISLSGCLAMKSLMLSCPNLRQVNLSNCPRLQTISCTPVFGDCVFSNSGDCPTADKSVKDYMAEHPTVASYTPYNGVETCIGTSEGVSLWQGFLNVVLLVFYSGHSWGGEFEEEDLVVRNGSQYGIKPAPTKPATFNNLLSDLSKLSKLLAGYYKNEKGKMANYFKHLSEFMENPTVSANSTETEKKRYLKFLRHHPAFASPSQRIELIKSIWHEFKSMGTIEAGCFRAVMTKLTSLLEESWFTIVISNELLYKVYLNRRKPKQRSPYKDVAQDLLKFLRHFYVHGAERTIENRQQMMENTDELDYMAAHHFSVFIGNLLFYFVLELDMSGRLRKVWDDYTL